jgi:disulfide bond formation protein DsbB|tara:strand:+ start:7867 stop:8379 length:513 start_codon:yes stop_codon:yes gene_type:complete
MKINLNFSYRSLNYLGFIFALSLILYALYAQYILNLEACPLCIFQRVAVILAGILFLICAIHSPKEIMAKVYHLMITSTCFLGMGISARHVYLQNLPPDKIPSCGPGLGYLFDTFPIFEVLRMIFTGSGECAVINWSFIGLSMPSWVFICFLFLIFISYLANWKTKNYLF